MTTKSHMETSEYLIRYTHFNPIKHMHLLILYDSLVNLIANFEDCTLKALKLEPICAYSLLLMFLLIYHPYILLLI